MFPFSLLLKSRKNKNFEPMFEIKSFRPSTPGEIRKTIEKLSRCPKCQFIIFDNYWSDEIESKSMKVCSTCGERV